MEINCSVIARYEAIPNKQSRYAGVSVQFAIASYLAMTGDKHPKSKYACKPQRPYPLPNY